VTERPDPEAPAPPSPPNAEGAEPGAGAAPGAAPSVEPPAVEPAPVEPAPPIEPSQPYAPAPSFDAIPIEPPAPPLPPTARRRRLVWLRPQMSARDLAILLRGALLLAVTGFFLASLVLQLTGAFRSRATWNLSDFVSRNELAAKSRLAMLAWLGAGLVAGGLVALILYRWRASRRSTTGRAARVLRAGRVCWPLMLPSVAWSLVAATGWDPLARIGAISVAGALAELSVRGAASEVLRGRLALARLLARAGEAARRRFARARRVAPRPVVVVVVAAAFYAVWMSVSTILQHRHFGTAAADLGNYDTMFFNALHGHPFRCPAVFPKAPNWSMLSTHAELTMFALLPFYALRPGAEVLLVLQAVALATGAIPVYRFTARRLPRGVALVLALAYLGYAPMQQANFFDVHFPPFAVAFTLWAVDMLDARRPVLFALFYALAIGCREDVALGFAVLGVYLLLTGKRGRVALGITVVSVAYFAVMKGVVMPRFEGPWFTDPYKDVAGAYTYGGALKTMLANPLYAWKVLGTIPQLAVFMLVLVPVAFLPLRHRLLWLGLVPMVPFAMLTNGYTQTLHLSLQFVLLYVPFLFLSSAVSLAAARRAPEGRARLAGMMGGVVMATFVTTRVWGAMPPGDQCHGGFRVIPPLARTTPAERDKARDLAQLAAKIPKDASLAVTDAELPHVSARVDVVALRNGYDGPAGTVDYVLFNEEGLGAEYGRQALSSGGYEVVEARPASKLTLLRKKKH
jgi:uncharacterized membrane protein